MKNLKTIDLFAGAGGITEGFRQAGAQCVFANDFNPHACETFKHNHPEVNVITGSIENLDVAKIRKVTGLDKGELDVLVGGPPLSGVFNQRTRAFPGRSEKFFVQALSSFHRRIRSEITDV